MENELGIFVVGQGERSGTAWEMGILDYFEVSK